MMKTITTPTGIELLIVPVPEDSTAFKCYLGSKGWAVTFHEKTEYVVRVLGLREYSLQILGTLSKDTIDFDCSEIVSRSNVANSYKNYRYLGINIAEEFSFHSAADSFRSLLQSYGWTFENPYGEEPQMWMPDMDRYNETQDMTMMKNPKWEQWEAAEKNVVKKVVVIEKLKTP